MCHVSLFKALRRFCKFSNVTILSPKSLLCVCKH
uniref:Uncharacterized protein n=1 Tax=Anguilla anguilla TaxID=7936 RepID=A0A0E9R1F9_ANGAN